ncbi:hypothetical protein BTO06_10520 [Tenacibaculum sp. SZ-18]|uniref:hypothetical protein n=1 Tax=Tenacibaculum sp. SZ-18 TaxID=754423 RepID=UPI000CA3976C|nr:hypothetical protein [Tenacibaculum sp. SZ-18]AUC15549.1 hypothetical protein BTO06_10520 [Tenacibaculum sp. SZ-18]
MRNSKPKKEDLIEDFRYRKIRKGSRDLILLLQNKGHSINIYTASFRNKHQIRKTFEYYGIKVDKIINQKDNSSVLRNENYSASKYLPAFNFDLHIDDLTGVDLESKNLNFTAIIIKSFEANWGKLEIQKVIELEKLYFEFTHFKRMKMMEQFFKEKSQANTFYTPQYETSKSINLIFENTNNFTPEIINNIENQLSKVKSKKHFGDSQ